MGFDGRMADRIRAILGTRADVDERKMFGGLCFMVSGHMCCGLTATDFMVRVGPDAYDDALSQPHARPMDFTGRPLVGMVYVAPAGTRTSAALAKWVKRGVEFASNLPPKTRARKKKRAVPPRLQRRLRG
ncbi:MAG: TfoX/Sxy family protein [Deltaproteobacteria bacterium]|nr:TfoX/Sxy family protein [Deltaproteobacteria bacterium]